jgi:hypothetical protein
MVTGGRRGQARRLPKAVSSLPRKPIGLPSTEDLAMAIRRESPYAPTAGRFWSDVPRSAGPAYVAALRAEAHRLARQRAAVEAAWCVPAAPDGSGRLSPGLSRSRTAERRSQLMIAFHAVLDRLYAADRFEDALAAFRAYRAERERRLQLVAASTRPRPDSALRAGPPPR